MKWLGWIIAVLLGVLCAGVRQANAHKQGGLDAEIREETKAWDASAAETLRGLELATRQFEEKQAQAKQKSAELQARQQAAEAQRTQLTEQISTIEAEAAKLENVKAESVDSRRENVQEIRRLQAQIAGIMPDLEKLKNAMVTVMEPAEAAQGRE